MTRLWALPTSSYRTSGSKTRTGGCQPIRSCGAPSSPWQGTKRTLPSAAPGSRAKHVLSSPRNVPASSECCHLWLALLALQLRSLAARSWPGTATASKHRPLPLRSNPVVLSCLHCCDRRPLSHLRKSKLVPLLAKKRWLGWAFSTAAMSRHSFVSSWPRSCMCFPFGCMAPAAKRPSWSDESPRSRAKSKTCMPCSAASLTMNTWSL
mmetsp:Transcript_34686/g.104773  ORF Transcript_34686/g.104773 Transcript_34686/m.104773 type:complete len:208 (-) Transcript_34686:834-1457(-)